MISTPNRARALTRLAVPALAALVLAACGSDDDPQPPRGAITSERAVATLSKAQIDASTQATGAQVLTGPAQCDVQVRQIVHQTAAPRGESARVSAALLVPVAGPGCSGPFPILSYSKGTDDLRARTLANPSDPETGVLIGFYASQGYVVVASDYLGYAESTLSYHPYLHAESQAATAVDAIRAARTSLVAAGTPLSGKLFLTGYSQGGHAAMSAHRAIEADTSLGMTVTGAAPMSGPYNMTGMGLANAAALPTGTGGSTLFTPMLLTGYQRVYGNIYPDPSAYFKPPYVNGIDTLLPGATSYTTLLQNGRLPVLLADLLTPAAVADLGNPASGVRAALEANTLLSWTPRAPVLLCGGARDPVVPFQVNTPPAAAAFQSRGASVTVVDVEQVPALAAALPPANATVQQLASYHGAVLPLCAKVVRDNFLAVLR